MSAASRADASELLALEGESVGGVVDADAVEGEVQTVLEVPVVEVVVHVAHETVHAVLQRAQRAAPPGPAIAATHLSHRVKSVFSERDDAYSSDISSALSAHRLLNACCRSRDFSLRHLPHASVQEIRFGAEECVTQQTFRVDALHHVGT